MRPVAPHHGQRRAASIRARSRPQEQLMLDIVMLALGAGLFAASIGYAYACERL
jgi:hypothetical protein